LSQQKCAIKIISNLHPFSSANLSSVALGTTLGWTSPAFPKIDPADKDLSDSPLSYIPDADELSWIGSLVALGALMGNSTTFYQLSTKTVV
jgi:hypothetical protein